MHLTFLIVPALIFTLLVTACKPNEPTITPEPSIGPKNLETVLPTSFIITPQPIKTNHIAPSETQSAITISISVPQGISPVIDGKITAGEWQEATIESFTDGCELLLLQSEGYLYIGVRANTTEMIVGNIFVNRNDEISILHVSARLGTAIYRQKENIWQQIKGFDWCCREVGNNASDRAEREDFFKHEGWLAVNSRFGTPNELEYQIKIGSDPIRLAVNYLTVSSNPNEEKSPWPPLVDDDITKPTPGGLPQQFDFSPDKWAKLTF